MTNHKPTRAAWAVASSMGTCGTCGKQRYANRKVARAERRRLYPGESTMQAYQCGDAWHIGHLTPEAVAGLIPKPRSKKDR